MINEWPSRKQPWFQIILLTDPLSFIAYLRFLPKSHTIAWVWRVDDAFVVMWQVIHQVESSRLHSVVYRVICEVACCLWTHISRCRTHKRFLNSLFVPHDGDLRLCPYNHFIFWYKFSRWNCCHLVWFSHVKTSRLWSVWSPWWSCREFKQTSSRSEPQDETFWKQENKKRGKSDVKLLLDNMIMIISVFRSGFQVLACMRCCAIFYAANSMPTDDI